MIHTLLYFRWKRCLPLFAVFFTVLPLTIRAEGQSTELKSQIEKLIISSQHLKPTPGVSDATDSQSKAIIESSLHWTEIARRCFDDPNAAKNSRKKRPRKSTYDKLSAKDRHEFETLLRQIVTQTAYGRLYKFWKDVSKYQVQKASANGDSGTVRVKFFVKPKPFVIDYDFRSVNGQWLIEDVVYDEDIRYSENIREQVQGYLEEKGHNFRSLISKLKERLAGIGKEGNDDNSPSLKEKSSKAPSTPHGTSDDDED